MKSRGSGRRKNRRGREERKEEEEKRGAKGSGREEKVEEGREVRTPAPLHIILLTRHSSS